VQSVQAYSYYSKLGRNPQSLLIVADHAASQFRQLASHGTIGIPRALPPSRQASDRRGPECAAVVSVNSPNLMARLVRIVCERLPRATIISNIKAVTIHSHK